MPAVYYAVAELVHSDRRQRWCRIDVAPGGSSLGVFYSLNPAVADLVAPRSHT
jgi:hypothetical protein